MCKISIEYVDFFGRTSDSPYERSMLPTFQTHDLEWRGFQELIFQAIPPTILSNLISIPLAPETWDGVT